MMQAGGGTARRRRARAAALVLSLLFIAAPALLSAGSLDIWCVWGGGSSGTGTVIRGPDGTVVLYDLGEARTWAQTAKQLLDREGIHYIHYAVAGHYHTDHICGLYHLVNLMGGVARDGWAPAFGTFYDRGGSRQSTGSNINADYLNLVNRSGKRRTVWVDGTSDIHLGDGAVLRFLTVGAPDTQKAIYVRGRRDITSGITENNKSITALVTYKHFDFYVGSDAEGGAENAVSRVVADDFGRTVDVLHVDHHGSDTNGTSSSSFLQAMGPEVAVISVWNRNGYGHPRRTTVERLQRVVEQRPQRILRLAAGDTNSPDWAPENMAYCHTTNGHVSITTDGHSYTVSGNGINEPGLVNHPVRGAPPSPAPPPPPPVPPPDPRAAFTASPGTVAAGGELTVEWALDDIAPRVDVYFGVETPTGAIVTMGPDTRFRQGIAPVLTDFNATGNPRGRFSFAVPPDTDPGAYTLMAVCVEPRQSPERGSSWVTGLATQAVVVK
ncbi:MAG: hypothetical protein PHN82_05265 [bacterium]|nr:hypothetical protein [bacterium]